MKIPVKYYEEVTNTMTAGDVIRHQVMGEIHREGNSVYLVTLI